MDLSNQLIFSKLALLIDVYKRQKHIYEVTETEIVNPYDNSTKTQGDEKELTLFTCSQTVSYTHLDVYKRQVYASVMYAVGTRCGFDLSVQEQDFSQIVNIKDCLLYTSENPILQLRPRIPIFTLQEELEHLQPGQ